MPYLKIKKQNSLDRTPALSDLALFVRFLCGQTFQKSKLHALPLFPASFSHFTPSCLSCHPSITNQFHHDTLSKWAFVVLILLPSLQCSPQRGTLSFLKHLSLSASVRLTLPVMSQSTVCSFSGSCVSSPYSSQHEMSISWRSILDFFFLPGKSHSSPWFKICISF